MENLKHALRSALQGPVCHSEFEHALLGFSRVTRRALTASPHEPASSLTDSLVLFDNTPLTDENFPNHADVLLVFTPTKPARISLSALVMLTLH